MFGTKDYLIRSGIYDEYSVVGAVFLYFKIILVSCSKKYILVEC
jgi:hypothetical protein